MHVKKLLTLALLSAAFVCQAAGMSTGIPAPNAASRVCGPAQMSDMNHACGQQRCQNMPKQAYENGRMDEKLAKAVEAVAKCPAGNAPCAARSEQVFLRSRCKVLNDNVTCCEPGIPATDCKSVPAAKSKKRKVGHPTAAY